MNLAKKREGKEKEGETKKLGLQVLPFFRRFCSLYFWRAFLALSLFFFFFLVSAYLLARLLARFCSFVVGFARFQRNLLISSLFPLVFSAFPLIF